MALRWAEVAAPLISLDHVVATRGTKLLLDDVSIGVSAGDRIGVVGRNGAGKSTLVAVLTGELAPVDGRIVRTGGLDFAVVAQDDRLAPTATIRDVVFGSRAEHEWASSPFAREVLAGLLGGVGGGAFANGLDTVVAGMSGGERRRVSLAAALIDEHDLLILDEPTNHLDLEVIDWLATHLVSRRGALLVVTHDRWFLDAVTTRTWEVVSEKVEDYSGGYASYILARTERDRRADVAEEKRRNILRKELAWLRRGAPARSSKPLFRVDAALALIEHEPPPRDKLALRKFASARLGKQVYDVEDVTVHVGDRDLFSHLTWHVGPGDRIGVLGANGAGKTTLLRALTGAVKVADGRLVTGKTVQAGLLLQSGIEVPPDLRVREAVEAVSGISVVREDWVAVGSRAAGGGGTWTSGQKSRELTASQLLDSFGFAAQRQQVRVGDLSGGERRRLQLMRLLMSEPNVMLLDEPTNDLDTDTLAVLEDYLDGWPGTLLVVSHDRYLLERACDRFVGVMGDGRVRDLPGGVEEYVALRRAERPRAGASASRADSTSAVSGDVSDATARRDARKALARIERQLSRVADREVSLHEQLAAAASEYETVATLDAELTRVLAEKRELEEQWLDAADVADQ